MVRNLKTVNYHSHVWFANCWGCCRWSSWQDNLLQRKISLCDFSVVLSICSFATTSHQFFFTSCFSVLADGGGYVEDGREIFDDDIYGGEGGKPAKGTRLDFVYFTNKKQSMFHKENIWFNLFYVLYGSKGYIFLLVPHPGKDWLTVREDHHLRAG